MDQDCKDACTTAYQLRVTKLFNVLSECLLTAESEESKEDCKRRFREGLAASREARNICIQLCDE
jgi:hypothetical protein